MAADQERADRVKALKQERPDLTWRRIADHVGVTERSATDWARKGGIDYANAKKLAEIFEVEVDYIWRGTPTSEQAPSPFAGPDSIEDRLDAIDERLDRLEALLQAVDTYTSGAGDTIIARLDALQDAILGRVDDVFTDERFRELGQAIVEGRPAEAQRASRRTPARS